MIKNFLQFIKESVQEENFIELIFNFIKQIHPDCFVEKSKSTNDTTDIEVVFEPIEPEEGSWSYKADFTVNIGEKNGKYICKINGIHGQYGCDEPEDDGFDVEFDYDISSTSFRKSLTSSNIEDIKKFIEENLSNIED